MNARRCSLLLWSLLSLSVLLVGCSGYVDVLGGEEAFPVSTMPAERFAGVESIEVTRVVSEVVAEEAEVVEGATAVATTVLPATPTAAAIAADVEPFGPRAVSGDFYVKTESDHLSTFALDVDTGSYTLMRQYVQNGGIPPADRVRVEEFVNFFDGGYAAPEETFALYADGAPSPNSKDDSHILRFGVQGREIPEAQRQPSALTFVIDTSGSMSQDDRLGLVKQSLGLLLDQLDGADTVALVTYGNRAEQVLGPTPATDRQRILEAIDRLRAGGSTNAEAGLLLGYRLANEAFRGDGVNRVILCSDGMANVGATDARTILDHVQTEAEGGITLTAIGVGMENYSDAFMEELADSGDGQYLYVDTLAEGRRVFVDGLSGTLQTIAWDAKVQVDFNPEVVAGYRLLGYENREVADGDFRNNEVDAGEIGAGHSVTALYAVQLHPNADGRIATMQLRWQDPETYLVQETNQNMNTWDLADSFATAAPHYRLAVVVAQFAELLRESPWVAGTRLVDLHAHIGQLVAELPADGSVAEFGNLLMMASPRVDNSIPQGRYFMIREVVAAPEPVVLAEQTPAGAAIDDTIIILGGCVILCGWWFLSRRSQPAAGEGGELSLTGAAQLDRARQYRRQVHALLARRRRHPLYAPFRHMAESFDYWEARMGQLVQRLVAYEQNELLQEDMTAVAERTEQLKLQLAHETDAALRRQMNATLSRCQEHEQHLKTLALLMRRTQLQLDAIVTAMGTIYSQLQLLEAMDVDSNRAQQLTLDIEDEVMRLHDLLAAVDEIRNGSFHQLTGDLVEQYAAAD